VFPEDAPSIVRAEPPADRAPAGPVVPTLAFDLAASRGLGRDTQHLTGGDAIDFGDLVLAGPAAVRERFELSTATVSGRGGIEFLERRVRVEGVLGVAAEHLDLRLESGGERARDQITTFTPVSGVRASVTALRDFEVYGEALHGLGFGTGDGVTRSEIFSWEAGVAWSPRAGLSLLVGWHRDDFLLDRHGSDVDLALSGVTAGVAVQF
jgi:hypothetical protein